MGSAVPSSWCSEAFSKGRLRSVPPPIEKHDGWSRVTGCQRALDLTEERRALLSDSLLLHVERRQEKIQKRLVRERVLP